MLDLDTHFNLYTVNTFFDAETCRELIVEMRSSPESPAVSYGQESSGVVNDRVRRVSRVRPPAETVARVAQRLTDFRGKVGEHFGVSLKHSEEPQFLCYRPGDFFVAHQDGNTGLLNLSSDQLRLVSVSIFLNDQAAAPAADIYCGGSLVFSDWRNGGNLTVKGEAGKLVAFRAETTHEIIPVTDGERYAIVSWYG